MASRRQSDGTPRCSACGTPVHRHRANQRVPFNVVVDLTAYTTVELDAMKDPNRLVYCLPHTPSGKPQLRFITPWHDSDCTNPHVIEHRCPPTTLF
jgi:hypothetical protein